MSCPTVDLQLNHSDLHSLILFLWMQIFLQNQDFLREAGANKEFEESIWMYLSGQSNEDGM